MTKNEVLDFIKKYHNPEHKSLMTGIPITDENMKKINFVKKEIGIPLHLRWRGPKWKIGYHTKTGATKVSVYARDRSISWKIVDNHYIKMMSSKNIFPDF